MSPQIAFIPVKKYSQEFQAFFAILYILEMLQGRKSELGLNL